MRASFLGFEIAKTGLQAAETGLDVTGQNMAKMNTEGYSRQTIEQTSVYYNSTSYKYALVNSDRIGQGVSIGRITQVRDAFLDARYRSAKLIGVGDPPITSMAFMNPGISGVRIFNPLKSAGVLTGVFAVVRCRRP